MKRYHFFQKCHIFFKGMSKYFILILILSMITGSMSIIEPIINANIVTNITKINFEIVIKLALLLLFLRIIMQLIHYANNVLSTKVKQKAVLNIRIRLCKALMDIATSELDKNPSGVFDERVKNDPYDITNIFTSIQTYIIDILTNIGIVFYVYVINPYIGLLYTIAIFILFLIQKYRIQVLMYRKKESKVIQEENSSRLNELLKGLLDIKLLKLKKPFLQYVEKTYEKNYQKRLEMSRETYLYWAFYYCTRETLTYLILIIGAYLVVKGNLSATNLLILWMYRSNIFLFVINVYNLAEKIKEFEIYSDRMIDLLEDDKFEKEKYGTKNIKNIQGKVQFEQVTFSYNKKSVLNNISFTIEPKQKIGFVGKSGVGKTTILNLVSKLYNPNQGNIYIDQYNLNELSEESLRKNIAVVPQNPYIFNLSVKENLLLANPKLTDKKMREICDIACIRSKIESLEDQYDTILGEGGTQLSGGEKQRLAIARALASNSKIILLDEATSALDNNTQNEIFQSLTKIGKEKTIIIIAHRFSTVVNCDKIYVMDKGKIVAEGTHEELLKSCSLYRTLYTKEIKIGE